jgi:hypothetical protein
MTDFGLAISALLILFLKNNQAKKHQDDFSYHGRKPISPSNFQYLLTVAREPFTSLFSLLSDHQSAYLTDVMARVTKEYNLAILNPTLSLTGDDYSWYPSHRGDQKLP